MENRTPVNVYLIENRMKMTYSDYLQKCIETLESVPDRNLLNGIGDLIDEKMKTFVRNKLRNEILILLNFYKAYPITD